MGEETTKSPNPRCRSIAPCSLRGLSAGLFTVAVVLLLSSGQPAFAQSGETEDTVFQISEADCDTLQQRTGLDNGSMIFVCDADRRSCQLVQGGQALGFCADRFQEGVSPVRSSPLEIDTQILASTHGTVTGFVENGSPADLVCETFVDQGTGVRACRTVVEGAGALPNCDGYFLQSNNADACDLLADLLVDAGAPEAPNISFAIFFDVDAPGQPGSEALLVCGDRRLQCASPTATLAGIAIEYQFVKQIIDTPHFCKAGGTSYYCHPP